MSIVELELTALTGATVDGGWPQDLEAEETLHTLVQLLHFRIPGRGSGGTLVAVAEGAVGRRAGACQ